MRPTIDNLPVTPVSADSVDVSREKAGSELKRGTALNAVAMIASNFRAVFTLLIARMLGPIALGIFSVAWATLDVVSKIGICGLDDAVTTFVARAEAVGDRVRSRLYFRVANLIAVIQSAVVAALLTLTLPHLGPVLGLEPPMVSALIVIVWALPGIALYRINTSVSRGAKVMQYDIYTRGLTDPGVTAAAFLLALPFGAGMFAPELAAIVGSFASGILAFVLAASLFRDAPKSRPASVRQETRKLIRYAIPIGADQFLNAFIWRVDVIILGCLVNRAPGVTLTTVGIYGGVVGLANGLRRVSQPFTPIFTPVVAGMTATGAHREAAATYSRLLNWMLWILLPATAAMILASDTIVLVYGSNFQQGGPWLAIVALAGATNAFVNLGETVIMVQRPGLNFLNSVTTCIVGTIVTFWFVCQIGVMGAALGILITYFIQGVIRSIILRTVFHWPSSWNAVQPVMLVAVAAIIPAVGCRLIFPGVMGQLGAAMLCLTIFTGGWFRYHHLGQS